MKPTSLVLLLMEPFASVVLIIGALAVFSARQAEEAKGGVAVTTFFTAFLALIAACNQVAQFIRIGCWLPSSSCTPHSHVRMPCVVKIGGWRAYGCPGCMPVRIALAAGRTALVSSCFVVGLGSPLASALARGSDC